MAKAISAEPKGQLANLSLPTGVTNVLRAAQADPVGAFADLALQHRIIGTRGAEFGPGNPNLTNIGQSGRHALARGIGTAAQTPPVKAAGHLLERAADQEGLNFFTNPAVQRLQGDAAQGVNYGAGTTGAVIEADLGIGNKSILTKNALKKSSYVSAPTAAATLARAGTQLPKYIPSVDLVATAGAATKGVTPQDLVSAGISDPQARHFYNLAIKRGWYPDELQGMVGLDLIAHAYSNPPPLALRALQNFGTGVIQTASLPVAGAALAQEAASGHIGRAVTQIGNIAGGQASDLAQHPLQAIVSNPYTYLPLGGALLKTVGEAGHLIPGDAAEREVQLASTGQVINRGARSKNFYEAAKQVGADKAASQFPAVARNIEAGSVDRLVAHIANDTAPEHHAVQVAYKRALDKVGAPRATTLMAYDKAGGDPAKVAAYYKGLGNERQAKFFTKVADQTTTLSKDDQAFRDAHAAIAAHTTATNVGLDRFSDTAGLYAAHRPSIMVDARAGNPVAQRLQGLHDEWINALKKHADPEQLAPLFGAYDQATRDYVATREATGASSPVRVAEVTDSKQKANVEPTYRSAGKSNRLRPNPNYPRQQAGVGKTFESGNYLIDPQTPLRENLQAQRMRTSVGLTSDEGIQKIGGYAVTKGEERKPGYVFVPRKNLSAVGKVMNDMADSPVGANDYYAQEAGTREKISAQLKANSDSTGEFASESGYMIPEGSFKRLQDYVAPEPRSGYDKFIKNYQRVMTNVYPSSVVNATIGNYPLALAAGAGLKSGRMALASSRDASLVPFTAHGSDYTGPVRMDTKNPITSYMNTVHGVRIKGWDFGNDAAYFSKILPGAAKRAKQLGYPDMKSYLRDVASGKVDIAKRDAALDHMTKFIGNWTKAASRSTNKLGKIVLFPGWLQHMTKLMLVTLPIDHPRRLALINVLAQYGNEYRKEHGVWPAWMEEYVGLFQHTLANSPGNTFTRAISLGSAAPQGSAGGIFDTIQQPESIENKFADVVNPIFSVPLNTMIQDIKNRAGYGKPVSLERFAANQAAYAVPGMSKFAPNTAPDSIPFLSPRQRTYTDGSRSTAYVSNKLPYSQRPSAQPVTGFWGDLARIFGAGMYDVPNAGQINNRAVAKQENKYNPPLAYGSYPKAAKS